MIHAYNSYTYYRGNLERTADRFGRGFGVPLVIGGYQAVGNVVIRIANLFSKRMGMQIESLVKDPLCTGSTALVLTEPLERFTLKWGLRKPVEGSFFYEIDRVLIAQMQIVYHFFNGANSIMRIPKRFNWISEKMTFFHTYGISRTLDAPILNQFRGVALYFLEIIAKSNYEVVSHVVKDPWYKAVAKYTKNIIHNARIDGSSHLHMNIKESISATERAIRRKYAPKVATRSVKAIVPMLARQSIKAALSLSLFALSVSLLPNVMAYQKGLLSLSIFSLPVYLTWIEDIKPWASRMYDAYDPHFHPKKSFAKSAWKIFQAVTKKSQ